VSDAMTTRAASKRLGYAIGTKIYMWRQKCTINNLKE
jgi:hypothetical protein